MQSTYSRDKVANEYPTSVEVVGCHIHDYNQVFGYSGHMNGFPSYTLAVEFLEEEDAWNDWRGNGIHQIIIFRVTATEWWMFEIEGPIYYIANCDVRSDNVPEAGWERIENGIRVNNNPGMRVVEVYIEDEF